MRWGLLFVVALVGGCASLIDGTLESRQYILFASTPPEADVLVNGTKVCSTPCRHRTPTYLLNSISLRHPNFDIVEIEFTKDFNVAVAGNILFGGLPGMVLDGISGRVSVSESSVHIEFKPQIEK
tara:strand:- start:189 stop:563 length:375 start_codon:yes stop_codon:yes gene_type:complete